MEDVLLLTAGHARRRRAGRRPGAPPVQVVRRRRVPGRLAAPVRAARPVARRPRRDLRGRRPRPDDLLLRRRRRRLPARVPRQVPRHHLGRAGAQLPLHPPGRRGGQQPAGRHDQPRRRAARPAARRPAVRYLPTPDEVAEADAVADAVGRCAPRARPPARWPCCCASTPSPRPSRRRWPAAASPTSSAAPRGSSTAAEVRAGGHPAARRGPRRRAAPTPSRRRRARRAGRHGLDARGARGPRPGPRPLGVAAGAGRRGRGVRQVDGGRPDGSTAFVDDLDRRASEQHAPVADGVTLATLHAAKGLEWDAVFLVRHARGHDADHLRRTPAEVEEERRLLYVGMTRARDDLTVSWAAARKPGGRGNRKPSRFLDPLLPDEARAPSAARARSRKVPSTAASAAGRSPPAPRRSAARCADCPASYDEALFERLREWRKARADEDERARVRGLHRRHPPADRRAHARPPTRRCCAISGVGRPSSTSTATTCSALLGLRPPDQAEVTVRKLSREIPTKSFAPDDGRGSVLCTNPRALRPDTIRARCPEGGGPHDQQHPDR